MSEVQAEFDELVNRNALSHPGSLKLDQLIAKGAKLTYKGTYYQFFREAMMDRDQTDIIWYLNNVEYDPEFVNKIVQDVPFGDLMAYILKSKKCEFYIEKLMNHRDIDETVKANLQKLRNSPEVKTEDSSKAQAEFDVLWNSIRTREKFESSVDRLNALIAKGAKLKNDDNFDFLTFYYKYGIDQTIWILDNIEFKEELIEEVMEEMDETSELYYFIFGHVVHSKHAQYYYKLLIKSDDVSDRLKTFLKKLIKN